MQKKNKNSKLNSTTLASATLRLVWGSGHAGIEGHIPGDHPAGLALTADTVDMGIAKYLCKPTAGYISTGDKPV